MNILKFNTRKSKAQAMVEFAIVLPILLLVVYGLIETGRLIFVVASVNNATRQAVRYGSTSGEGPNGVPRYQDCAGIREAAQKSDFLNAFEDADITITYDQPIPDNPATAGDESQADPPDYNTCNGTVDTGISAVTGDRVNVTINSDFNAIFPKFLPFLSRTAAGGNPIVTTSSRTLLLTINVAPPLEPTTVTITTDDPDASDIDQFVLVTVLVEASTTPTGQVLISGADQNCTITLSGGTGSCSVQFKSPGSKTISASYVGDATHEAKSDTEPHTVKKAKPMIAITDTPNPSLAGDKVTVTVSVTGAFGTPTGTVVISGADAPCNIDLSVSTSCQVTFATNNRYTLTATYSGDTNYLPESNTAVHYVIAKNDSVTIITSHNPDPSEIGKSVTVYVTVKAIGPKSPSGTVTITGADTSCTITLNKGAGSCTVVFNSIGVKTLTATYTPDGGSSSLNGSSDSVSHSVELAATTTNITSHLPSPSIVDESVLITVSVTGGSTQPTGTVTISGADTNCVITLAGGTGSCSVIFNSSGSKILTAAYSGDGTHAASNDTESHVVSIPPIEGCDIKIKPDLLQQTPAGAMALTIHNTLDIPLQMAYITVIWNHDKGHTTGDDKTLRLQYVNLNGTVFWSGNELGETYFFTPASPVFLQPGDSTITFTFHQIFDRWDNTELISIVLDGCSNPITQNQH